MEREHRVGDEWLPVAIEQERQQEGERKHHQNDERLRVQQVGAIENRGIQIESRPHRRQAMRHQALRDALPVLMCR